MIKIFSTDKIFFLTEPANALPTNKNTAVIKIESPQEMREQFTTLNAQKEVTQVCFTNDNVATLLKHFSAMFHVIEAAGGVVKNKNNEWLFIYRNDKWDLPKGKIEKGEDTNTAALREVEEECGISKLSIIKVLPSTFHIYQMNEKAMLKRTYWFEMYCEDDSPLIPQIEEGITKAEWIDRKHIAKVHNNTYTSIKDLLEGLTELNP